jgi:hypothetical protein
LVVRAAGKKPVEKADAAVLAIPATRPAVTVVVASWVKGESAAAEARTAVAVAAAVVVATTEVAAEAPVLGLPAAKAAVGAVAAALHSSSQVQRTLKTCAARLIQETVKSLFRGTKRT